MPKFKGKNSPTIYICVIVVMTPIAHLTQSVRTRQFHWAAERWGFWLSDDRGVETGHNRIDCMKTDVWSNQYKHPVTTNLPWLGAHGSYQLSQVYTRAAP